MILKRFLIIAVCILIALSGLIYVIAVEYRLEEHKYFQFLGSQPSKNELLDFMGDPHERITDINQLLYRGWPLPKYIPQNTEEVWIYDLKTGCRIIVFVPKNAELIHSYFASTS